MSTAVSKPEMSREQIELVKDTIAREQKLTDEELRLFLYTANRLGLDPLARQIYAVRRKGKVVMQTGIDGYRLIAQRTGEYAGNDDPTFELSALDNKPVRATVTVYRLVSGQRCAFSASARWEEYYPGEEQGFMWRKMPHTMLGKCAEGLALRKAFPAELSGVYTDTEMEQAGRPDSVSAQEPRTPLPPEDFTKLPSVLQQPEADYTNGEDPIPVAAKATGPVMRFGKSKGQPLSSLKSDELLATKMWCEKKDPIKFADFIQQLDEELAGRGGE